ncbi:acyl-CoA dehydrogenase family protein [Arthrobacter zhangbolii]|uniref:Acyl-CoA dehydrogenase family protein n=1 Tax=Arthrobacter zhangbolii TaxID=2886936 RepID=A0A9X1MAP7_9MICC|nr:MULTISPECIES: acyl-CoA dehydrogenase family protein [Arthrobacter]MCC3274025.1 acyl-CoA dehydrogenase family protein [Arthrobacter zhangbolii]MCC3295090.1 acyl-CoA dehydrogenase family protein [Arthrobacter zhangbolii]MDN3905471.1 acyl-CoA dehydrogenase family protein [Arthrobacter sp. YD2]UON92819.1 acyl-CoA dehydrogenase family protein [Arthrobacter zhangbolii]
MTDATDFYLLEESLTDEQREVQLRVRTFANEQVAPIINDYWDRAEFPFELVPKLAGLGVVGTTIEGYGCPGMDRLSSALVSMEMSRVDGSVNTFLSVQSGLTMGSINLLGSEEQKNRWLPRMANLDAIGSFALTEPDHGSDSVGLETSARRDGDSYILNGKKRWIGNASFADVVVIWARDEADGKVKGFVMEKNADGTYPQGYQAEVITGKVGKRAILQPDITITNLRIPAENVLVDSKGFRDVSRVLMATRGNASWEALGHAMAAYEAALAYSLQRRQFGKQIAGFQLVQNKLANMLAELTAMQLICFRITNLQEAGKLTGPMSSMAKMHTAKKARWICSEARDMLGGNGLLLEYQVARHMTDMEVVYTYEGTDSIQSLLIGREITGINALKGE